MMVEEDGCEVLIPIKSVLCCGKKLRPINGFWRCPKCNLSYGPVGGIRNRLNGNQGDAA